MTDEEAPSANQAKKKRRLQGACDICRKKKSDSAQKHGQPCTNCVAFNSECTHIEPVKKRGPKSGYVEQLERRVNQMEEILRKALLNVNLPPDPQDDITNKASEVFASTSSPQLPDPADSPQSPFEDEESGEDLSHIGLAEHMKKLRIVDVSEERFFGPSSHFMLVKDTMEAKSTITGHPESLNKRPQYWTIAPWENVSATRQTPLYHFPEVDLMVSLINLYFEHVNYFFPLLHAPTFRRAVSAGLHLHDSHFGATLLLVCAVASRFSNDPRVFMEGYESELSAGWKWFDQVQLLRKSLYHRPTLYELQFYCLAVVFLLGTSAPQTTWPLVGVGLRFALELGVHRRKPEGYQFNHEDELKKRAFWILLSLERMCCAFIGRPLSLREDDYDVELPIDCDDEYWDHPDPELAFKQPSGKPSKITYFIKQLQLSQILAFTLRALYSPTRKPRPPPGMSGIQWDQQTVAQLDSSLNSWIDSVPDHLRWDPTKKDPIFLTQSALLYSLYYHLQIQIHRPFINKSSPLTMSSLAICANAARSCSRILGHHTQFCTLLPHLMISAFNSGLVLLLCIWGGRKAGLNVGPAKEYADVKKCMSLLKAHEHRFHVAGRLWDILNELASVDVNSPHCLLQPSKKRSREDDYATDSVYLDIDAEGTAISDSTLDINTKPFSFDFGISIPNSQAQEFVFRSPEPVPSFSDLTDNTGFNNSNFDFDFGTFFMPISSAATEAPLSNDEINSNTVNAWSSAPSNFNWIEWGNYITNMGVVE